MKRRFHFLAIAVALAASIVMLACEDDEDPAGPATGSIAGTITFQGTWPTTGNVQLSVFSAFPPTGAPDAFTDPISPTASHDYQIDGLEPGEYAAVVIGWRDPADPPGAKTIGMYWAFVDSVAVDGSGNPRGFPVPVTVRAGETQNNVDMVADLDVAP
jgi:hypothetical protein